MAGNGCVSMPSTAAASSSERVAAVQGSLMGGVPHRNVSYSPPLSSEPALGTYPGDLEGNDDSSPAHQHGTLRWRTVEARRAYLFRCGMGTFSRRWLLRHTFLLRWGTCQCDALADARRLAVGHWYGMDSKLRIAFWRGVSAQEEP